MKGVYELFPNNVFVACTFVEALMQTSPWKLWDLNTGLPTSEHTLTAKGLLEEALLIAPNHPGIDV
jgi:hypothetical protein